ncbi:MAG: DUF192 domain-containing protein [Bacillota bacterium]
MRVYNASRGVFLAHNTIVADSFFARFMGLMGRPNLPRGWCMVLNPCRSIHTMFMRFPLDIIFLDGENRVIFQVHEMPPFRFTSIIRKSKLVIELESGSLAFTGTTRGDIIDFC